MSRTNQANNSTRKSGTSSSGKTKSDRMVQLLNRANGATIVELQKATDWQAHSVRGFLSGTVRKRMGLELISELDRRGVRRYKLGSPQGVATS